MKIPKIRFSRFSEEWKEDKLSNVCKVNPNSGILPEKFIYIDLESVENGLLLKENYIDLSDAPSRAQRQLIKDDILFQTVRPYQKNNFYFDKIDTEFKYVASTGYAQLRANEDSKFLYQYLHTQNFVNNVLEKCTGTSYPAINSSDLSKIIIYKPSLEEQQKIGDFFILLDKRIEQQEQKIALLKDYKKAMMQKIFSQKIRFKDENGNDYPDWEEKKLGEMFEIKKGIQISKKDLSLNGQKCILYGELFTRYDEIIENVTSKTNLDILPNSKYHDILMPSSDVTPNGLAKASCLLENDVILGGDINILRYKNENVFPPFFSYQINYFKKKIMDVVSGTTIKHVYSKNIEKLNYKLPLCIDEQEKITSFLLAIENNIKTQKEMVETLKKEKISLLNKMFV